MPTEPLRRELLSWEDIDKLMEVLLRQLREAGEFDALVMITRGGIVPGGLICEALDIQDVLTASVSFPEGLSEQPLAAWPEFLQFPSESLLANRRILIVDDVWGSGRTSTAVSGRVEAAGGSSATCVLHFNPYRSLFSKARPDYFAATTDAWIIYPWEIDHGVEGVSPRPSGMN
nr:phosphoribosyltransferase [Anaerolineae bacterium]